MVTVALFYDVHEAVIAKSYLEENGIPAFVPDLNQAYTNWMVIPAMGGIRLQVDEADKWAAENLLKLDGEPDDQDVTDKCPNCGSPDIVCKRSLLGLIAGSFFLNLPLPFRTGTRHCRRCKHEWREQNA